jgi:hypothetical protein
MSRSRKKPYYKDKGMGTHEYWRMIRREWKQDLTANYYKDDFQLRSAKSIIEDWNYSDYSFFVYVKSDSRKTNFWSNYYGWTEDDVKKYSRK